MGRGRGMEVLHCHLEFPAEGGRAGERARYRWLSGSAELMSVYELGGGAAQVLFGGCTDA